MAETWHVAETKPFRGLLAEREVVGFGYPVFNPKVITIKKYRKRKPVANIKLYVPGYLFIQFDIEVEGWQRINKARGVKSLMYSSPELPVRISDNQLVPFMELWGSSNFVDETIEAKADKFLFQVGAEVMAVEGPFASFPGTVESATTERVRALIMIFGRHTPVEGPPSMFELRRGG